MRGDRRRRPTLDRETIDGETSFDAIELAREYEALATLGLFSQSHDDDDDEGEGEEEDIGD